MRVYFEFRQRLSMEAAVFAGSPASPEKRQAAVLDEGDETVDYSWSYKTAGAQADSLGFSAAGQKLLRLRITRLTV